MLREELEQDREVKTMGDRSNVLAFARSLVGDPNAQKKVCDIYNTAYQLGPRKIMMKFGWAWCACTWSAIGIQTGNADKMGVEISCGELIKIAKEKGIWVEKDGYVPFIGDGVVYDWDDNGEGDNTGWPDHIGLVDQCYPDDRYFVTIEGNYNNAVKRRTVMINGRYIRGFIVPKYDEPPVTNPSLPPIPTGVEDRPERSDSDYNTVAREVISGKWGAGAIRKSLLQARGYDYERVQTMVNEILNHKYNQAPAAPENTGNAQSTTTEIVAEGKAKLFDKDVSGKYETMADLHLRHNAGSNMKSMAVMPKGTVVQCYGYYNDVCGVTWPYVVYKADGVSYIGFCSKKYLKKL